MEQRQQSVEVVDVLVGEYHRIHRYGYRTLNMAGSIHQDVNLSVPDNQAGVATLFVLHGTIDPEHLELKHAVPSCEPCCG